MSEQSLIINLLLDFCFVELLDNFCGPFLDNDPVWLKTLVHGCDNTIFSRAKGDQFGNCV